MRVHSGMPIEFTRQFRVWLNGAVLDNAQLADDVAGEVIVFVTDGVQQRVLDTCGCCVKTRRLTGFVELEYTGAAAPLERGCKSGADHA